MAVHALPEPDPDRYAAMRAALDDSGRPRVVPASFWAAFTVEERCAFAVKEGCYVLPTVELIERLSAIIDGRRAIEIGAGNGVVAAALGIPATDSFQQQDPRYAQIYDTLGQPPVRYGPDVERLDAAAAVRKYKPEVVIACWVTHRYNAREHQRGGNEAGVVERYILERGAVYVHVGNGDVHRHKPILALPHDVERPPWLYSRAMNGTPDEIRVWQPLAPHPGANRPQPAGT